MQRFYINLTVPIPSDSVLISKVEFEELKQRELTGVYWSMKQLEQRVNRKQEWIKLKILYPDKFRKVLDIKYGGFVFYPNSRGQSWAFHATKMANFLDNHFDQIFS